MRFWCFLLCAALLLSLCACAQPPVLVPAADAAKIPAAPTAEPTTETAQPARSEPEAVVSEDIATAVLSEYSKEVYVRISYPVLLSSPMVSASIEGFVEEIIAQYRPEATDLALELTPPEHAPYWPDSDLALELTGRITFCSEELVSVVFEGLYNAKTAVHPTNLLISRNFDPQTGERIRFADRYVIDSALYEAFAASAEATITEQVGGTWPKGWGTFAEVFSCDEQTFIARLTAEETYHTSFTQTAVYISLPTSHSACDHQEFPLPYDTLTPIQ